MSGVLMRNRSISEMEFYKTGCDIRAQLTHFLMNDKNIPKSYRFVFTFPGIDLGRKLVEEISAANKAYPKNAARLTRREAHQDEALELCEKIIQHLQWIADTLPVKIITLEILVTMIEKEEALIRAWQDKNKLLPDKFK
jgi:hypothetical protein